GADGEEIALDPGQPAVEAGVHADRPHDTQERVQLVHVPDGVDARIRLADARAVVERRIAGIARPRVECHFGDYTGRIRTDLMASSPPSARQTSGRRAGTQPNGRAQSVPALPDAGARRRFRT